MRHVKTSAVGFDVRPTNAKQLLEIIRFQANVDKTKWTKTIFGHSYNFLF